MTLANFRSAVDEYATGKTWYWYIPLWVFGLYAFIKLFSFSMIDSMPGVLIVPYSFNFTMHEFAHILTGFLPPVLTAAAGSGSELLLGAGLVLGAFWYRNYFALLFCCLWADLSAQSAGAYMADAIPQRIPLVSLGGALSGQDPVHDWHFIFSHLHLLPASDFIGTTVRVLGHVVGLFGIVFSAWMIYKMAAAKDAPSHTAAHVPDPPRPAYNPKISTWGPPTPIYPEPTKGPFAEHHTPPDIDKPNDA